MGDVSLKLIEVQVPVFAPGGHAATMLCSNGPARFRALHMHLCDNHMAAGYT